MSGNRPRRHSHFAAIGMGSNLGDPLANMNRAAALLTGLPGCTDWRFSGLYQSEAVDCPEPLGFLNAAVCCVTGHAPQELLQLLLAIEDQFGRTRPYPNAPRPLDLDLLLFDDQVWNQPQLTLPHPRMHQRLFVLAPLSTICPDRIHPLLNLPVVKLLEACHASPQGAYAVTKMPKPWPVALI